ncbi:sporulation protein Cse60 [Mucilaginibacter lappiensis]|uniref:Uncharacterized protein n=1 Tax=Mucilaginibacter lappiensis TaxID=354630 RepID=A0A841JP13_9SPHI|nr:sporulation protein Cse60 [Mucilaginibacter lappiensis]MBB6131346.1 hypothetical protein [Mucilaginibacter lappiensis]
MKQVKIFYESSIFDLEKKINAFLSEQESNIDLIDIKFLDSGRDLNKDNTSTPVMRYHQDRYAALILYTQLEKQNVY